MSALSPAAVEVLRHVKKLGMCTQQELEAVQQGLGATRTALAVRKLPYNLHALGYLQRVPATTGVVWTISTRGRDAHDQAARGVQPDVPVEVPTRRVRYDKGHISLPNVPVEVPTRRVRYDKGHISLPIAPRWVFDLGGATP